MALALANSAAVAFQEQKSGGVQAPSAQAPAAVGKDVGLTADTNAVKSATGTEVRIPGLGRLGVLPKMDFGLELLYGASEQSKPVDQPRAGEPTDDDLTIRGTVKHRF